MFFRLGLAFVLITGKLNAQQMDEYSVKAAFLCNFVKFVEWPAAAPGTMTEAFQICVLGHDPFGRVLEDVVRGKDMDGRHLSVRRFSDPAKAVGCRILFVSSSEGKRELAGLAATKFPGLLTVAEAGSSASEVAVITFILQSGKVRFEINMAAAEEEKLRLSSKLLSLATALRR